MDRRIYLINKIEGIIKRETISSKLWNPVCNSKQIYSSEIFQFFLFQNMYLFIVSKDAPSSDEWTTEYFFSRTLVIHFHKRKNLNEFKSYEKNIL